MSTTKKSTRARPADQDAAAPASTSAPDADVSPPHADAAAAYLAAGELAGAAAEALAPDLTCAWCDLPADPATVVRLGRVAVGACDEHHTARAFGLGMLAAEGRACDDHHVARAFDLGVHAAGSRAVTINLGGGVVMGGARELGDALARFVSAPAVELATLQAQESDAEALAALCAAQHQHPRDDVQRAIGVLAGRIAARVLA